jgi:hypothetical protein
MLVPHALMAQNLTGEIDGTIHDSSGGVVPDSTVTVRNTDQNTVARTVKSDQQGQFTAPLLAIGHYSVAANATGFQTSTVSGIDVHVNQPVSIPIVLAPGAVSQTVNVTAESLGVQLDSAAAGTLVNNTQMTQQSLSSRNFLQLLSLQPGVTGGIPGGPQDRGAISSSGTVNSANYSMNGLPAAQNGFFVDGEDMQRRSAGGSQIAAYPGLDFIQEMNLQRSNFGAQNGGSGSAFVSVQTKSGSTTFHGSAFEFFRSQVLNANGFFNNLAGIPRPGNRYNDFGYAVGGPVWIPHLTKRDTTKTFFFFGQEYLRSETAVQQTLSNIPTAAQRQGIFNAPVCVAYNAAGRCTNSATAIKNIDPTARAYLTDIINKTPLPNNPNDPQGLIASAQGFNNETQTMIRIDHRFNDKLSVFFRYLDDPFNLVVPYGLRQPNGIPGVGVSTVTDGATIFLGHATYVINSKNVLEGGFAHMQNWVTALPAGLITQANSPDIKPVLPFPSTLNRVPNLNINGSSYAAIGPYNNREPLTQVFVNDSSTLGRHTLRFGVNLEFLQTGNNFGQINAGAFRFAPGVRPVGSSATPFDQAFANFLLGQVTTFQQDSVDAAFFPHTNLYEAYVQDDFHLLPRLTVNAGVRYSYIAQPTPGIVGGYGYQPIPLVNFVPTLYRSADAPAINSGGLICTRAPCATTAMPNSNYNALNGLILSNDNSPFGPKVTAQPNLNFAPRLGFAYDVFGNGHTAVRGGYGIYYLQTTNPQYQVMATRNPPNVSSPIISNTAFGNPGSVGALASSPVVLQAAQPNALTPYVQMWSLDIQQQIGRSILFDAGYYGNHGVHEAQIEDINEIFPGLYAQTGIIPGNTVTPGNTQTLNRIRPYLGYGPINSQQNAFSSNYNALQVSVRKRFSGGSLLAAHYTYSKTLTNGDANPQNTYDLQTNYGPIGRTHVFTANFVYHLPLFRDERGWVGHVLGGWETSGIVSFGSGNFLTAHTINVDPAGLGILATGSSASGGTPDYVSNPNSGAPHVLEQWFNTSAFTQIPAGQYRIGNAGIGIIQGAGYENWDLSVFKNFRLKESWRFQLRGESFNTFNHTNWAGVGTTLGQTDYGQITGTGPARVLQLAGKLTF